MICTTSDPTARQSAHVSREITSPATGKLRLIRSLVVSQMYTYKITCAPMATMSICIKKFVRYHSETSRDQAAVFAEVCQSSQRSEQLKRVLQFHSDL